MRNLILFAATAFWLTSVLMLFDKVWGRESPTKLPLSALFWISAATSGLWLIVNWYYRRTWFRPPTSG